MQLFLQVLYLRRRHQAQVAAFQTHVRHGRQIAQGLHPVPEAAQDSVPEAGVGHGGALVQDHAPDGRLRTEIQKALEDRQKREGGSSRPQHQHHGGGGEGGDIVGAGLRRVHAQAVVIAHDPFDHVHVPVRSVFRQEGIQGAAVEKEGVQVGSPGADDPAVEHGVDIVRPAFEGPDPEPPVRQSLEHGAGDGGLPAAAVGARQGDSGYVGGHDVLPKREGLQRSC